MAGAGAYASRESAIIAKGGILEYTEEVLSVPSGITVKVELAHFSCRLADGKNAEMFMKALEEFVSLKNSCTVEFLDTQQIIDLLKQQIVFTSCSDGEFDVAEKLYEELFILDSSNIYPNSISKKTKEVLKAMNTDHQYLKEHTCHFISKIGNILKEALEFCRKPFILQAATTVLKTMEESCFFEKIKDIKYTGGKTDFERINPHLLFESMKHVKRDSITIQDLYPSKKEKEDFEKKQNKISEKIIQTLTSSNYLTESSASQDLMRNLKRAEDKLFYVNDDCDKGSNKNSSSRYNKQKVEKIVNKAVKCRRQLQRIHKKIECSSVKNSCCSTSRSFHLSHPTSHKLRESLRPTFKSCKSSLLRRKWDSDEETEFYHLIKVYGTGNWAKVNEILDTGRTNVNLKDKWRTMLKTGRVKELQNMFGSIKQKK